MIQIDGTHGEGGGSILRQALALSIMTQKSFRIVDIRANRPKPGLSHQHLNSVELAKRICNAKVTGSKLGSTTIEFFPNKISKNVDLSLDVETAGSLTLMLQSVFLPSVFSGKKIKLRLKGGTDVNWSPPFDYFKYVFVPFFQKYANIECTLTKRGYYPKGEGEVMISIDSKSSIEDADALEELSLGKLITIKGLSHASMDLEDNKTAETQAETARMLLAKYSVPVDIKTMYYDSSSTGSGITVYCLYKGKNDNEIKRIGVSKICPDPDFLRLSEDVVNEFNELVKNKVPVDEHLADQLIPFLLFTGGSIKTNTITNHTLSNIYVAELFLKKKFNIKQKEKIITLT